jgi:hypothetical protein
METPVALVYSARARTKGQTTSEGLNAFGAEWCVVSAAGAKVERSGSTAPSADYGAGGYGY